MRKKSFTLLFPLIVIALMTKICVPAYSAAFAGTEMEEEDEADYSFAVKSEGKKPDIIDFVNAILTQEDCGEKLGEMEENWKAYLSGQPLPSDRSLQVDRKHGFIRYDAKFPAEEDYPHAFSTTIEYKVMKCTGGKQTLVVENTVECKDGEPIPGQFSGLTFYLYDARTGRMEQAYGCNLGADSYVPEGTHIAVHSLRQRRNTILCKCHLASGFVCLRLIWNGKTFRIK